MITTDVPVENIVRGELYYASLGLSYAGSEQRGHRPVLIIQSDDISGECPTIIVAAVTSKPKYAGNATHHRLQARYGLSVPSVVLLEQLRTLDKSRLKKRIGMVDAADMSAIDQVLSTTLGINPTLIPLCNRCAQRYYDTGEYIIKRADPEQNPAERDRCICMDNMGYHRVPNGRLNKHGTPLHDLVVHETEAAMVRMIFQKSVHEGMGSHRMAEWLNEQGLRTHSGAKFRALAVLRILRNRIYCGYLVAGEIISPQMEQLRIIEVDEFERAQVILQQRHEADDEKRHISMRVKGQAMLSGNLFCSHCGGRITTSRYQDRKVRKDGTEYVADHMRYTCYHRTRNLCKCDGQATFKVDRVDEMVSNIIREIFSHMQGAPREEKLKAMLKRQEAGFMANRRKVSLELERNETQLTKLQDEIGKALLGQSAYSTDDLSQAITTLKAKISEGRVQLEMLSDEHTQQEHAVQSITPAYTQFKSWAEEFDGASMEKRKMIACQLFTRIELGKNYSIAVTLNMTYQQFCEEWEGLSERMASMS